MFCWDFAGFFYHKPFLHYRDFKPQMKTGTPMVKRKFGFVRVAGMVFWPHCKTLCSSLFWLQNRVLIINIVKRFCIISLENELPVYFKQFTELIHLIHHLIISVLWMVIPAKNLRVKLTQIQCTFYSWNHIVILIMTGPCLAHLLQVIHNNCKVCSISSQFISRVFEGKSCTTQGGFYFCYCYGQIIYWS